MILTDFNKDSSAQYVTLGSLKRAQLESLELVQRRLACFQYCHGETITELTTKHL